MKKLLYTLLSIIILFSCSEDAPIKEGKVLVKLKFAKEGNTENGRSSGEDFIEIEAELIFENSKWILKSENLVEIESFNSETGEVTYGYEYIGNASSNSSGRVMGGIYRGYYGFDGECFIYGTLYEGDNGQSIFVPADLTTQLMGFGPICPPEGEAYA